MIDLRVVIPDSERIRPKWRKEAVACKIYLHSFKDSDDDRIDNLLGISSKLDYISGREGNLAQPGLRFTQCDNGLDIPDNRKIMAKISRAVWLRFRYPRNYRRAVCKFQTWFFRLKMRAYFN